MLGKKIAEGAQAEIFEATWQDSSFKFVMKVFKEGSSVLDLQKQWPLGMLNRCVDSYTTEWLCSPVLSGTVLMNGRFAFMMFRYAGDLRKLIDKRMERNGFCAPFSSEELKWNMLHIALGMVALHQDDIVHRDLKASNVLIQAPGEHEFKDLNSLGEHQFEDLNSLVHGSYHCRVGDYECWILESS